MVELSSLIDGQLWHQLSSSSSYALEVAVVIATSIGMSRRAAVEEEFCISCCCGVGCITVSSFSIWLNVWGVARGRGLVLLTGLPSKATMVMMTLLAFLVDMHVD